MGITLTLSCALTFVVLLAPVPFAHAQEPREPNVRLLAIGNFLGQFDGFCEPPGAPYDLPAAVTPCLPGGPGGIEQPTDEDKKAAAGVPWPAALGGLIGAERWIAENPSEQRPRARLLLQGNNQTPDFADSLAAATKDPRRKERALSAHLAFWDRIARLQPTVIALGPDDLYRSLRLSSEVARGTTANESDTTASRFVDWVRDKQGTLPFVASNTIVSVTGRKLEAIAPSDERYELLLDEESSIGWLKEFSIKHPCGSVPAFQLESSANGSGPWQIVQTSIAKPPKPVDCQTTLRVTRGALQPGTYFRVRRHDPSLPSTDNHVTFAKFRTHAALTPAGSSPGSVLIGWPAVLAPLADAPAPSTAATPPPDEMLIVSLVSQNARDSLGTPVWAWKPAKDASPSGHVCAAVTREVTCRIDFLPPAEALTAILEQVLTVRTRLPFVVLLSMMDDEDTLELMERFPEIRVVVLPPDSALLGRAARETPAGATDTLEARLSALRWPGTTPTFSGDLGMIGILDADKRSATRVVLRPEWVGETIADLDLAVRHETDATSKGSYWDVRVPSTERARVVPVPGVPLVAEAGEPVENFATTVYRPQGHPELRTPPYVNHLSCQESDARPLCKAFRDVWTDAPTLLAVAAAALRTRSHADVVVVPRDLADDEALAWIKRSLSRGSTSWLSEYVLQRVVFRPYRFVRTTVGGDKLLTMLQRVLDDPLGNGSTYCIAGLGDSLGCPSKLSQAGLEKIRVNGRVIQPGFFYTVTMPDRVAEQQELRHSEDREDGFDAIDALEESLNPLASGKPTDGAGDWYPDDENDDEPAPPSLTTRLEERATSHPKHYISITELEFGLIDLNAIAPDGGRQIPNNIDTDVKGAKSYTSRSFVMKVDSVALDYKRQALRGIFELEHARRSELGADDTEIVSYERDRLLFGPRVDLWKVRTLGDLRPYVGFFREGPLHPRINTLTASRSLGTITRADGSTVKQTESAGFETGYRVDENMFTFVALGADAVVSSLKVGVPHLEAALSRAKLEWARGESSRVPLDLRVDGDGDGPLPGLTLAEIRSECPDSSASARTGDAGATLNAFFACHPDALAPTSRVELLTGEREQRRTQFELEGAVSVTAWGRAFKITLSNQLRNYKVVRRDGDLPSFDLAIDQTNRFKMQLSVPVMWRLEFAPSYEHQYARIKAGDVFRVKRWDVKFKLPLFVGLSRPPFAG
jgi:hypothetical protein